MSQLVQAMAEMRKVFDKHAKGGCSLSKEQLAQLLGLRKEDVPSMDGLFNRLDQDRSGKLEFKEYAILVAIIASSCKGNDTMVPELEQPTKMLRTIYDDHAGCDKTMDCTELCTMLRGSFGRSAGDEAKMQEMFKLLDADGNKAVDYEEFVTFVATLAVICHE